MNMDADDIVIAAAARTPMGGFLGALDSVAAPELGAVAIAGALAQAGLDASDVDEVLMGNVLAAGLGQAPARQAALGAGLGESVPCTTISKVCGSGMKAVMYACDQIRAGSGEIMVAGGMESMSRAPHLLEKTRAGLRLGHARIRDHMFVDGLEDAYTGRAMGEFAQETADLKGITREEMDAFALASLARANEAIENGYFSAELVPVTVGKGDRAREVNVDEQPGAARPEKIPHLRPAFSPEGTITAANSSSISDGAAALLVTTGARARALGVDPLARVAGYTSHAQAPGLFTTAPIAGINKLLEKTGWRVEDVDLFEINEAFAMVTMMAINDLGLDHAKVNINGGACALGHPLGASGARIIVTLLHALKRQGKTRGVASLCIGGGEATSIGLEVL
ncbi:thiolase family protein [Seongchinamella unica]|uniref:Thiolase family protein n=2 Tax=Seongchinamella unica TaxID=2547392 RepID=A0A4R5LRD8_9GAMM|nr:thiolase family protein [Seongchinamella unica]